MQKRTEKVQNEGGEERGYSVIVEGCFILHMKEMVRGKLCSRISET